MGCKPINTSYIEISLLRPFIELTVGKSGNARYSYNEVNL